MFAVRFRDRNSNQGVDDGAWRHDGQRSHHWSTDHVQKEPKSPDQEQSTSVSTKTIARPRRPDRRGSRWLERLLIVVHCACLNSSLSSSALPEFSSTSLIMSGMNLFEMRALRNSPNDVFVPDIRQSLSKKIKISEKRVRRSRDLCVWKKMESNQRA